MKKFLLLSHYAAKKGFKYPETDCPLQHRQVAHQRLQNLQRFWDEGVLWQVLEVEKISEKELLTTIADPSWDAIWLSGSPYLLNEAQQHSWINHALKAAEYLLTQKQTPVIGICFGLQLLGQAAGGKVKPTQNYKAGETAIYDLKDDFLVTTKVYHQNFVTDLPSFTSILGQTKCKMPYIVKFNKKVLGVQSHPECALESLLEMQKSEEFWKKLFRSFA